MKEEEAAVISLYVRTHPLPAGYLIPDIWLSEMQPGEVNGVHVYMKYNKN